jgi:MFS family permease
LKAVQAPLGRMFCQIFGNRLAWNSLLFFFFFSASQGFGPLVNIYLLTELGWGKDPHRMQIFGLLLLTNTLAAVAGALLGGRLHPKILTSFRFFTVFLVVSWISIFPWLLVHQSPDDLTLIFSARVLMGALMGFGSVLGLTLIMRLSPKTNEGFMFALLGSAGGLGSNTLESKTVTAFSTRLGGLIPAFFTLIPYGVISLFFLGYILKTLDSSSPEAELLPVPCE